MTTGADPDDARRRVVRLTTSGQAAWAELEQRSDGWPGTWWRR